MNFLDLALGATVGNIAGMTKGNYDARKINRINPENNNGIGVSTVYASDISEFETALLDANGTHPVERYFNEKDAKSGHKKWTAFAKSSNGKEITELGFNYDDCEYKDKRIILKKVDNKTLNLTPLDNESSRLA